jgi:DNA topoisomerase IB
MAYLDSLMVTIRTKQEQAERYERRAAQGGRSADLFRLRAEYAHAEAEAMLQVARSL